MALQARSLAHPFGIMLSKSNLEFKQLVDDEMRSPLLPKGGWK